MQGIASREKHYRQIPPPLIRLPFVQNSDPRTLATLMNASISFVRNGVPLLIRSSPILDVSINP